VRSQGRGPETPPRATIGRRSRLVADDESCELTSAWATRGIEAIVLDELDAS
jgi:hypothetical protein